jgi:short-chain Z-isoprenyl diphosphate synthase
MRRLLYALYERRLLRHVAGRPVPRHVGLILDGNRRYARDYDLPDPLDAYGRGADKLDDLLEWCRQLGIPAVTLWVFSTENFRRSAAEVAGILGAVESKLARLADDRRVARLGVRLRAVGRLELLPDSMLDAIRTVEAATASHRAMTVTIAIAYGGREEIVDALQALLRDRIKRGDGPEELVEGITPAAIGRYLYAPDLPDPDLIIRTSGEVRSSGFLLWQSAYSEYYFCDVHWPAFRKVEFLRAVRAYQERDRRFGR